MVAGGMGGNLGENVYLGPAYVVLFLKNSHARMDSSV